MKFLRLIPLLFLATIARAQVQVSWSEIDNGYFNFTGPSSTVKTYTLPNLSAYLAYGDNVINFVSGGSARTITLSGSPTMGDWFDQSVKTTASVTHGNLTVGSGAASANPSLLINGGSNAGVGGTLTFSRGGTIAIIGGDAAVTGSGTSNDLDIYSNANNVNIFAGSGPNHVATFSGTGLTITNVLGLGITSTDGLVATSGFAATAILNQWSPRQRFTGYGWKSNSTAASQEVDFITENQVSTGTANPTGKLVTSYQVNAGGYGQVHSLDGSGNTVQPGTATASTSSNGTYIPFLGQNTSSGTSANTIVEALNNLSSRTAFFQWGGSNSGTRAGINAADLSEINGTGAGGLLINTSGGSGTISFSIDGSAVQGKVTSAGFVTPQQFTSTIATGTAPMVVSSTTLVANLHAATADSSTTTTTATNATNGATVSVSNSASYFPAFFASSSNGNQPFNLSTTHTFNPSTGAMGGVNTLTSVAGTPLILSTGTTGTAATFASATNALTLSQGALNFTGATTITGGAGNMTITSGTGNSRTLALQSTTSGGTATTFLTGNADQSATFANTVNATTVSATTLTGTLSTAAQPNITSVGTITTLTAGTLNITGVTGLPAAVTSLWMDYDSGNAYNNIFIGNGTGYVFNFMSRTSSANTILASLNDTGGWTMHGPMSGVTALTLRPATDVAVLTLNQANSGSAGWTAFASNAGSLVLSRIGGNTAATFDLNGNATFLTTGTQTFGAGAFNGAISGVTTLAATSTATFGGATLTGTGIEVQGSASYQGIFRTDSTHRMYIGHDGASGHLGTLDNQPWNLYVNNVTVGSVTSTGLNSTAIGATTPSTGAFTTLSATGTTQFSGNAITSPGAGVGSIGGNSTNGLELDGNGGTYDVSILNKNRSSAMSVPTGTVNAVFGGTITTANPSGGAGAQAVAFGSVRTTTGLLVSTTTGLQVQWNGTLYTLPVLTTNP